MIVGYHIIFGTYGFWLPNDPRGSWSDFVGSWELFRYGGKATRTTERHSVAYRDHDRERRIGTKKKLKYPAVKLTGVQARAVGRGFARYFARSNAPAWACAILPDHVHLVVGRGQHKVETLVIAIKGLATRELKSEGIHPQQELVRPSGSVPKCFAQGEWKVFLDPDDVDRAVRYVEDNPVKEGLPRQKWSFVVSSPGCRDVAPLARSSSRTSPRG